MEPLEYFNNPKMISQKQYEALRMFFLEKIAAKEVAKKFGYTYRGFTTIISNFRKQLKSDPLNNPFFSDKKKGRKHRKDSSEIISLITNLRKKYYSIQDIKVFLNGKGHSVSEKYIHLIIKKEGFAKLPRRNQQTKDNLEHSGIQASKSIELSFEQPEEFKTNNAGTLCLMPYILKYGIDKLIMNSDYPETKTIDKLSSILSFIALKLSNTRRYSCDDIWCMDRGLGLFAKLNVLPKSSWFSSYSNRVTRNMNVSFLKKLNKVWQDNNLLHDTVNLDFTTIPYWGDGYHLENNWSGKRNKALSSMLAVLAQDQDSGIIEYGNTDILHKDENKVVLEFLDFYNSNQNDNPSLKYLIFDSKFTNYENLNQLDKRGIKFITIRRRGKNLVEKIRNRSKELWKTVRVERGENKKRTLKVYEELNNLRGYDGQIRQIEIIGNGKIKPAVIITNDFDLKLENIIRKYARRWLVEKHISEQIEFFHLNQVSSSMVIKVDFDLTMSILAYNLFRLFASDLERYSDMTVQKLYEKFTRNSGDIKIQKDKIIVQLHKKRNLPILLESMVKYKSYNYQCLGNKKLVFSGASNS